MQAGMLSHLLNCHAGHWTKSLQFQSTFDMNSMLLSTYFLKLFYDLTYLTKGSEQRKALFPPSCTCTWGLYLPASTCALQSRNYTCSHVATWKIEHGVEMCVQRLRSCWMHSYFLPLNLKNMGFAGPCLLKAVETSLWLLMGTRSEILSQIQTPLEIKIISRKPKLTFLVQTWGVIPIFKRLCNNILLCPQHKFIMKKVKKGA